MFYDLVVTIAGIAIFLFLFWKKLKEDYSSELIFGTAFTALIGMGIGNLISRFFFPTFWFWGAILGGSLGLVLSIYRFKLNFFETLDSAIGATFPWLCALFLFDSVQKKDIYSLGAFFVILAIYLLYLFLNVHYKKFSWYPSGKVGFSGLMVLGILFLLRGLSSVIIPDMLSFVDRVDPVISGIISFSSFLGVFHLARSK